MISAEYLTISHFIIYYQKINIFVGGIYVRHKKEWKSAKLLKGKNCPGMQKIRL